jgi:hypothetical protein
MNEEEAFWGPLPPPDAPPVTQIVPLSIWKRVPQAMLEGAVAGHVPKRPVCSELIPTMREYPPPPLLWLRHMVSSSAGRVASRVLQWDRKGGFLVE